MNKKKKILFIVVLWCFVFVAGELGVRIYCWAKGDGIPATNTWEHEWEWVTSHLKEDNVILYNTYQYDPLMGWANKHGFEGTAFDEVKVYHNSQGMRNYEEFSEEKGEKKRILFVGDSFTYGNHVANEETYPYQLGQKLENWEVINYAVSGYAVDQEVLMYEYYGQKYNPDIVILGFFVLDYFRNFLHFRSYLKPYFKIKNKQLVLQKEHIISPEELIDQYKTGKKLLPQWYNSYLVNSIAKTVDKISQRSMSESAYGWKLMSLLMERFSQNVRKNNSVPVWVVIPFRDAYEETSSKYDLLEELCQKKCEELDMPFVRLSDGYRKYYKENPGANIYRPSDKGGHLSALGNELTAQIIYDYLKEQKIIE